MRDPRAFLNVARHDPEKEPVAQRLRHSHEFERSLPVLQAREQASRCMGCGVPFCHTGCPLGNPIPDFNDLVARDRWREAFAALETTNNFPEITGRICPAPCETACVAGIPSLDEAVAIKSIEHAIGDRAAAEGWLTEAPPEDARPRRTGKRVAIVGSGPAGLACAEQLARAGHHVTVLEKDDRIGGLLRYGIPDFKLEKALVDARVRRMQAMGVAFQTSVHVGVAVTLAALREKHDAVVLAVGATVPRDLGIEGRTLDGIHFAMDYLVGVNRVVAGDADVAPISAAGKRVVILGGGDTGSDCLGTSLRQGASAVTQIELMPRPPESRSPATPWPLWPLMLRTSSSQEEGGERAFAIRTTRFVGDAHGRVRALEAVRVERKDGAYVDVPGSELTIDADLVLLALGFTGPDSRAWSGSGELAAKPDFSTDVRGVFSCGDGRRGQSLVVWAIWEGRETARNVDAFLMGHSSLPTSPYVTAP